MRKGFLLLERMEVVGESALTKLSTQLTLKF